MAATLLNESGKWHPDAIERAPAHGDTDKVRAAYTLLFRHIPPSLPHFHLPCPMELSQDEEAD